MIRKFGPLIKTRRFESKNGYFKSTFQSSKTGRMLHYLRKTSNAHVHTY